MGENFGSWLHYQQSYQQSPNLNFLEAPIQIGQQNEIPPYLMNFPYKDVSTSGTFPIHAVSGLPQPKTNQPEVCNWFYCLPRFRQVNAPLGNFPQKERIPAGPVENQKGEMCLDGGAGHAPKKFLVFDQSGDRTTLLYSSGIKTPVHYPNSWYPKQLTAFNLMEEDSLKGFPKSPLEPYFGLDYDKENHGDDTESEMQEDTEELNALLYSDDDDNYSEDDEETSTGHSPSTMTAQDIPERIEEKDEEITSNAGPNKRRKLWDGRCDVPSLMDTASSVPPYMGSEVEGDAESCCGNDEYLVSEELDSTSGKKRLRKEKIRDTITVLQSIIPGGKEKDPMIIIDEAIRYLRSLKVKAKCLGLDSL